MTKSLRCICQQTRSTLSALRIRQYQSTRLISSFTGVADQRRSTDKNHTESFSTRENAIKARIPSYAGWWTEVMNFHPSPQIPIDPTLLDKGHVFQGAPASAPATTPTKGEIKKGYSNVFPGAAVSRGSTTFATGNKSSLSKPRADSTLYHGFSIPVKPTPPGSEDCCMSGCAHCIYDIYEEDRQEYKLKLAKVLKEIEKAGFPPPPNIATGSAAGDKGDNSVDSDDDMDPSMKAFLELERKLKGS
ncbi:hypothetical protein BGX26_000008 [Mortierella sp. AD094]|nr:hypothetical protein BGX26_000008 [Mortierella sp. AD094]